jgi:two-component system, LytTR family, response regulator
MERLFYTHERPKLALPGVNKIITEFLDNIYYCMADDSYTLLYLGDGSYHLCTHNLKNMEDAMKPYHFTRCHRSYMVNMIYVKEILKKGNEVVLINGIRLPISEKYRQNLINDLFKYSICIG